MISFHSSSSSSSVISSSSSMLSDSSSSPSYKTKIRLKMTWSIISSSHNLPLQKFSQYDHIAVWKNQKSNRKSKRGDQKEGWMIEIAVTVILLQASLYFRIGKLNITSARIVLNHFNDLWCNIAFKSFDGICPVFIQRPTKWCRKMWCWFRPKWIRSDICDIDTSLDLLM